MKPLNGTGRALSGLRMTKDDGFFPVAGGTLHFVDWGGDGPRAIIVHAAGLSAGTYAPLAHSLRFHLHTIGLDTRGHGQSDATAEPQDLRDWEIFYDDLTRFLEEQSAPIVLVGHSMGGMVSLGVAARRPDLIRALVLIEPGIVPPSWTWWVRVAQQTGFWRSVPMISKASKRRRAWSSREAMAAELRRSGRFRRWNDRFLKAYIETASVVGAERAAHLRCDPAWEARCLATPPTDAWRFLHGLTLPMLVLYGDRSKTFIPSVAARFQQEVPHATCICFADTGHDLPMERPDQAISETIKFLKDRELV